MAVRITWFVLGAVFDAFSIACYALLYNSYESYREGKHMKQPKKVPRKYKPVLLQHGLDPKQWAIAAETETHLSLVHKENTNKRRCICKF